MGHILREDGGEIKFIRTNPLEIIDELKKSIEWLRSGYDNSRETINMMEKNTYKDDELAKLKEENRRLKDEMKYGFFVSEEENDAIDKWIHDWFDRKRNGDTYMGPIGGGFLYQFHPASIGIIAKVIAPDCEEFEFRNDL